MNLRWSLGVWLGIVVQVIFSVSQLQAEETLLLPTATEEGAVWRYSTATPETDWKSPDFDDSHWEEGTAGFGVPDIVTPVETVNTPWETLQLYLRKTIEVSSFEDLSGITVLVRHDEDVQLYCNGTLVFVAEGFNTEYDAYDVTDAMKDTLKNGMNTLAVRVSQSGGGQYFDMGLILNPTARAERTIDLESVIERQVLVEQLQAERWTTEQAWEWYEEVSPIVGCNYVPRTAVNSTEMWQSLTFDPVTIKQELAWAEKAGFNSVRVFVQFAVYENEPDGLLRNMDQFLTIADQHGLSVLVILLDDCFLPEPTLGPQPDPIPGVHNSQWTSSPGNERRQPEHWPELKTYVQGVVGHFRDDERILAWDLYNEASPGSRPLVEQAFAWAQEMEPVQPLTSCWQALDISDVLTFHDYATPRPNVLAKIHADRPAFCTECIARTLDSRFENVMPAFAESGVGWYMWGLVQGRIQTEFPWGSVERENPPEPDPWFHDLFRPDGTPYREVELELIQSYIDDFQMPQPVEQ